MLQDGGCFYLKVLHFNVNRVFRAGLATLAFLMLGTTGASPSVAQGTGAASSPASNGEIRRSVGMASMSMCILAQNKVSYKAAMQSSILPMVSAIKEINGSKIAGVNGEKPLSEDAIANGLALQLLSLVDAQCGDKLPPDFKKPVEEAIKAMKRAASQK